MDKAKGAVQDFLSGHGKKDTTVHERVAPAVTEETIKPTRHEEVTTAVDKEIHQDHYHTSVQPVQDREVLPEKHSHNVAGVEHRSYEHGDSRDSERRVAEEAGKFRDERIIHDTKATQSVAPVVGGEHVHHHVHETIQPIVQKETIQPEVVHTTVPIHEVHHNASQHHTTSTLPTMTAEELKAKGGTLTGREERSDHFEGEPRHLASSLGSSGTTGTRDTSDYTSGSTTRDTGAGLGSGSGYTTNDPKYDTSTSNPLSSTTSDVGREGYSSQKGSTGLGSDRIASQSESGMAGLGTSTGDSKYGSHMGTDGPIGGTNSSQLGSGTTGTTGSSTTHKPSLKDKLDPRVDATGDGKAGFMK